jgi:hypothetical protein
MLLDGVPIDERDVAALVRILPDTLGRKLTVAQTFRSPIVALTVGERRDLEAAVARTRELDELLRQRILSKKGEWQRRGF